MALDFAVTSPLRQSQLHESAGTQLAAAAAYEVEKLTDRNTAEQCAAHGITLLPVVAESFGGWGATAHKVFNVIARASAARTGISVGLATTRFYEGLSTKIMRANARSLLARIGDLPPADHTSAT